MNDFDFNVLYSSVYYFVSRILMGLIVIMKRRKRDNDLKKILNELMSTHLKYFVNYSTSKLGIWNLWIFNTLVFLLYNINVAISIYKSLNSIKFYDFLELISLNSLFGMQHIIMLHHASLLCYIYECFTIIQDQLKNEFCSYNIFGIYLRLCELLQNVNKIYNPLIMCLQLNFLLTISMAVFLIFIFLKNFNTFEKMTTFAILSNIYILIIIHLLVYIFICHKIYDLEFETYLRLLEYMPREYKEEV